MIKIENRNEIDGADIPTTVKNYLNSTFFEHEGKLPRQVYILTAQDIRENFLKEKNDKPIVFSDIKTRVYHAFFKLHVFSESPKSPLLLVSDKNIVELNSVPISAFFNKTLRRN